MGGSNSSSSDDISRSYGNKVQNFLDKGKGASYNQGLYGGLSDTTTRGLSNLKSTAQGNAGALNTALNANTAVIDKGGLTGDMKANINALDGVSSNYQDMYNRALKTSLTEKTMLDIAQGSQIGANNSYVNDLISQTNDDIGASVNAGFNASGRFGSGAHTGAISDALGGNALQLRYSALLNDQQRQADALASIEAARQTGVGNQSAALQGKTGVQSTQFGMGQQGLTNQANAIANSGTLFENALQPAQIQTQVGQTLDADKNAQLADNRWQWQNQNNYQQNLAHLQNAGSLVGATPSYEAEPNAFMQALGYGSQIAGAFI